MSNPKPLIDSDVVRARFAPDALEVRQDGDGNGITLAGYFSTFGDWYRIDSFWEGEFLERIQKGAFARTIANNRETMRVLFDHGMDPELGDKPLGPIDVLREDDEGPYYEVPLLDTDYNRDFVLPALQGRTMDGRMHGSVLGASFRMRVIQDEWNDEPGVSDHNPRGIPERTITETRVFEFGPVTFPANSEASADVRSLTTHMIERAACINGRCKTHSPPAFGTGEPPADPQHSALPPASGTGTVDPQHSAQTTRTTTQLSREIARMRAEVERTRTRRTA